LEGVSVVMKERHHSPDQLPIGMLINDASKFFHDRMRQAMERLGLRDGYRQLLFHLSWEDGVTQLDLVRLSRLKAPTISVTLKKMEEDGYVTRQTDPEDQRQVRVYITEKGRAANDKIRGCVHETERIFRESLTEEELIELRRILVKMRDHYRETDRGSDR